MAASTTVTRAAHRIAVLIACLLLISIARLDTQRVPSLRCTPGCEILRFLTVRSWDSSGLRAACPNGSGSGARLLDDLIGPQQQRRRDADTQRFGRLEVDGKVQDHWPLDRELRGLGPPSGSGRRTGRHAGTDRRHSARSPSALPLQRTAETC